MRVEDELREHRLNALWVERLVAARVVTAIELSRETRGAAAECCCPGPVRIDGEVYTRTSAGCRVHGNERRSLGKWEGICGRRR